VPLEILIFIQLFPVKSTKCPLPATTLFVTETASVHWPSSPDEELSDVRILYSKGILTVCQQLFPTARGSATESDHICMGLSHIRKTFEGPLPTSIAIHELAEMLHPPLLNFPSISDETIDVLDDFTVFPLEMRRLGVKAEDWDESMQIVSILKKINADTVRM
jgi:hypothetical protein